MMNMIIFLLIISVSSVEFHKSYETVNHVLVITNSYSGLISTEVYSPDCILFNCTLVLSGDTTNYYDTQHCTFNFDPTECENINETIIIYSEYESCIIFVKYVTNCEIHNELAGTIFKIIDFMITIIIIIAITSFIIIGICYTVYCGFCVRDLCVSKSNNSESYPLLGEN